MKNQLAYLYLQLKDFIDPLQKIVSDPDALEYLFYRYGWVIPLDETNLDLAGQFKELNTVLEQFLQKAKTVQEKISSDSGEVPSSEMIGLAVAAAAMVKSVAAFKGSNQGILPSPLNQKAFWEDIAEQLLDDLLETYLRVHQPLVYSIFHFWGVIRYESISIKEPYRISYVKKTLNWDQALAMLKSPVDALKQEYHWGDPAKDFDSDRFFLALEKALRAMKVLAEVGASRDAMVQSNASTEIYPVDADKDALRITLLQKVSWLHSVFYQIGLSILPVSRNGPKPNTGLKIEPILRGGAGQQFTLSDDFKMKWQAGLDLSEVFAVALFPDKADIVGSNAAFKVSLKLYSDRATPFYLLGNEKTSRVELSGISAELTVEGDTDDVEIKLQVKSAGNETGAGCKVLVLLDDADAFIERTVKTTGFEFSFSPELIWSSKTGFSINGNPDFKIFLPVSKKIGPVTLQNASIEFVESEKKTSRSGMAFHVGVGLQGELGPIGFTVEQIGLTCNVIPYTRQDITALPPGADGPTLGNLDLELNFAPPRGIGIEVSARAVTGGGYLYCDPARGEYMGVAQLNIKNKINLKAFGVLLTKLPGGKKGYSFLLMVGAEFPGIPLGLGFKLTGVGGLVGIHRRIELAKLTEGLRSNTFDDVLFPKAPLENPYALLNKINTIFPPAEGQYVIGLMGQITWGPESLLSIELGLILEFPEPVRLALIGVIKAVVSKEIAGEERTVLKLQVNFAGIIDFEKRFIRFDATLFESKLLDMKLEGDMALRIRYGASPDFVLTVGGFHPNFQPPALDLPAQIRRLQITLRPGNPSITVAAYVAVTANTFQFGVAGVFKFEKWGVKILGELTFDALFQFSPFRFEVGVHFLLSASWKGYEFAAIEIDGLFAGPSPWHIEGSLRLKVWIFSKTVHLEETWGDEDNKRLESVRILPLLADDLRLPGNWERTPGRTRTLVNLRGGKASGPQDQTLLLLHPNELLAVRENTVPLGLQLDKFGERRPQGAARFSIKLFGAGNKELSATPVKNHFAPAQFLELSDEQKLRSPSYEPFESGLSFEGLDDVAFDFCTPQALVYETSIVDVESVPVTVVKDKPVLVESPENFGFGLRNNAIINSAFGRRAQEGKTPVRTLTEKFVVAWEDNLEICDKLEKDSEAEARQAWRAWMRKNPQKQKEVTVLLKSEANIKQ